MEYFYFAFFLNIELDTVRGERGERTLHVMEDSFKFLVGPIVRYVTYPLHR